LEEERLPISDRIRAREGGSCRCWLRSRCLLNETEEFFYLLKNDCVTKQRCFGRFFLIFLLFGAERQGERGHERKGEVKLSTLRQGTAQSLILCIECISLLYQHHGLLMHGFYVTRSLQRKKKKSFSLLSITIIQGEWSWLREAKWKGLLGYGGGAGGEVL
jgi:hypothetical protein